MHLKFPILSFAAILCFQSALASPEQSVIKINSHMQKIHWIKPWQKNSKTQKGTGTGFVIEGNRVMTNAHVVSLAKEIVIYRYQDSKPYSAEVEFIGHDCDLAILKVKDPAFFEGIRPLPIGELPAVRSSVTTYGYPAGGQQISYTKGTGFSD